jgi:hypothetical protein
MNHDLERTRKKGVRFPARRANPEFSWRRWANQENLRRDSRSSDLNLNSGPLTAKQKCNHFTAALGGRFWTFVKLKLQSTFDLGTMWLGRHQKRDWLPDDGAKGSVLDKSLGTRVLLTAWILKLWAANYPKRRRRVPLSYLKYICIHVECLVVSTV